MLEELNRLQIFISAVLVGHPLSVLLSVVKIKHGSHRVHPDSVNMKFLNPVQDIGYQKILNFRLFIIENFGSPVGVLALSRVGMLKNTLSVKPSKPMGVRGKMSRHPVQYHAYFILVQFINQIHKILRLAVTGRRRIISRHLISPGAVVRILGDSHKLNMGIFHFLQIFHDSVGKFPIIVKPLLLRAGMTHP